MEPQAGNAKVSFRFFLCLCIWNLAMGGVRGRIQKRIIGRSWTGGPEMNSVTAVGKSWWGARTKSAVQFLGGVFAVLLLCLPAFSQGSFGRILGTVTDQSGGVVTGATVTVIDTERGVSRALTTDDAGAYNAPNLTAGNYTVRVEAKGFKRLERQSVVIEVGHEVRIHVFAHPVEQNQSVTVTESVPLVETTNATLGGTLETSDIVDLPLNGRDYQN